MSLSKIGFLHLRRLTITSLLLLSWTAIPFKVTATSSQTPTDSEIDSTTNPKINPTYQKAKTQLPPDFYALYRIVDRIARANSYDKSPWQIRRVTKYNPQAFASNGNSITLYNGILSNLGSDGSALACIISHEMAHHQQRHQVITEAEKAKLITQFQQEAIQSVLGTRKKTSPITTVGNFVLRNVIGGTIGNVVGGVLGNRNNRRLRKAQQRVNRIVAKRTEELEKQIAKQSQENEIEADKIAYLATTRAGFDPQGCVRAISVLERTPGVKFDEEIHPTIQERKKAIASVMKKYSTEDLLAEGKTNLSQTQPLTYNFSENQTSLRVNSRYGASLGDDIDKMFGR